MFWYTLNEVLKIPIKIICSSKKIQLGLLSIYKDLFFFHRIMQVLRERHPHEILSRSLLTLKNIMQNFYLKIKTGINNIGPALYLYKDLEFLSLLQAAHLERLLWRLWTLSIQTQVWGLLECHKFPEISFKIWPLKSINLCRDDHFPWDITGCSPVFFRGWTAMCISAHSLTQS